MTESKRTTVIVPVYSGLDQVRACIDSVIASREVDPFRVLVIYDCGPDGELLDYIRELQARDYIEVIENRQNLGFVKSVNIGLRAAGRDDVVILNSDTVVPRRWMAKFHRALEAGSEIGTITPMSNNAEIFSFPKLCKENALPNVYNVDLVDELLEYAYPTALIDAPTAVGFCMYIPRAVLDKVGEFDEGTFGRGYGEENDFCQRVAKAGFRNVVLTSLFVYHEGGVSFGGDKELLIEKHSEIIRKRYPQYFSDVHQFIRDDPLQEVRLRGVVALIAKGPMPCVIMIGHGMGGGTGRHVKELARYLEEHVNTVTVEPYNHRKIAVRLPDWAWPSPILFDRDEDHEAFITFISALAPRLVHIHHIKGLEKIIMPWLEALAIPHVVTLHDFYLIAANPTLTSSEGRYEPERATDPSLLAYDLNRATGMDWAEWRPLVEQLLFRAKLVIAPSKPVAEVYRLQYPTLAYTVTDHPDAELADSYPPVVSPPVDKVIRILVLGAISREKGADVLERTAELARRNQLPLEFHLLGYAYRPLSKVVVTHGAYDDTELKELVQGINPQFVWFPCLWPETYSYTLSMAMEMGLPVVVPNLGALSSRVKGRPLSEIVEGQPSPEQWLDVLTRFSETLKHCAGQAFDWSKQAAARKFYKREYIQLVFDSRPLWPDASYAEVVPHVLFLQPKAEGRLGERIVYWLVRLRDLPVVRPVSSLIPLRYQRAIKRLFMRRPLHEINIASKEVS